MQHSDSTIQVDGQIFDVVNQRIFMGSILIEDGKITGIEERQVDSDRLIMPGFIDAHVHIESSLLVPTEFARLALVHGTVATVSDPHEIANVLGMSGVSFMLENAVHSPLKFHFTAPSCVPATPFETAGAELTANNIQALLERSEIVGLSEMMNVPGVLHHDDSVMAKLHIAHQASKPVDGHAPALEGQDAVRYINAGISTDHECISLPEALHKLAHGMKVQIREGSAAQNLDDLLPLLEDHYRNCMFCSDDKHPDDLELGHVNLMVKRALAAGHDPLKVLWTACVTPVHHYKLDVGLLQTGDPADFIVVSDLKGLTIEETWIDGKRVAAGGKSKVEVPTIACPNTFKAKPVKSEDFQVPVPGESLPVIQVIDRQLITDRLDWTHGQSGCVIQADPAQDILKIAVLNRYQSAKPAVGFIRGFGLDEGALVSSVAHDSHNIVAVGTSDAYLAKAMNRIIETRGGLGAFDRSGERVLPLPVAGIMSNENAFRVSRAYASLDRMAKAMGSTLRAPFMTLSFMALLVIPKLKMSDNGLFDGERFEFVTR